MQINLNQKIQDHLQRVEQLAIEAAEDDDEKYASRASAMASLTSVIKEITRTQAEVINMERLMRIENAVIEALKKHLTPEQHEEFLENLETLLNEQPE